MVLKLEVAMCLACEDGKHGLCSGRYKTSWRVKRTNGRWSREVVYTTCQCSVTGHRDKGVGDGGVGADQG